MGSRIPENKDLSTNKLSSVFNNTAASYKFYWFISLIQLFSDRRENTIPVRDILIKMICNAWYPINYFMLNFGYSDKLNENIFLIQKLLKVPIDSSTDNLYKLLQNTENPSVNKLIFHFEQLVPYRFLSPWIKGSKTEVIRKSQNFTGNCLYRLNQENTKTIEINPAWKDYLLFNSKILLDFSYWNLLQYLQIRNPNIPNIGNKLIKPIKRENLSRQRNFWNFVISETRYLKCIYTGKKLQPGDYDIEHFIPWSFVSHNQLWNLIPADSSVNSSKGNKLPSLEKYFESFVTVHYDAINIAVKKNLNPKLLEDYLTLGPNIEIIGQRSYAVFKEKYYQLISPLIQIAGNSGFEHWNN